MFLFSAGLQVAIIAGRSSGTQESIHVFTQPGTLPAENLQAGCRVATGANQYYAL
jgi:hypothetical protein